jgi:hypothetical protein
MKFDMPQLFFKSMAWQAKDTLYILFVPLLLSAGLCVTSNLFHARKPCIDVRASVLSGVSIQSEA